MTAKLITLAGLLLMLSSSAFATPADTNIQAPGAKEAAPAAAAPRQPQQLAWQRVGSPLSLEA